MILLKNGIKILIVLIVGMICLPVYAADYKLGDVVTIEESISVTTELFAYEGITYTPTVSGKEYGRFSFKSIKNVSSSTATVSIDILLFDSKKENIGFVTYCSEQDFSGEYNYTKLNSGEATEYYFNVTDRYLVEGKKPSDVIYYAVYDDNKHCHVGGYTKYAGLTMKEISEGVVKQTEGDPNNPSTMDYYTLSQYLTPSLIATFLMILVVSYIIQGLIYNALHKRMYGEYTILVFIPICNQYLAIKMAFGEMVAKIYLFLLVASIPMAFMGLGTIVSSITGLLGTAAFFMIIYRLASKNYETVNQENLRLPPRENKEEFTGVTNPASEEANNMVVNENVEENGEEVNTMTPVASEEETPVEQTSNQQEGFQESGPQSEELNSFLANPADGMSESTGTQSQTEEGESELMNLFK